MSRDMPYLSNATAQISADSSKRCRRHIQQRRCSPVESGNRNRNFILTKDKNTGVGGPETEI